MKNVLTSGERLSRIFPDKGVRERFCADLRASVQGDFEEALERFLLVYDLSCQPRIVAKTKWLYKGRPHYFPYPNLLFVNPMRPYTDTIKELSHACQFRSAAGKRLGLRPGLLKLCFAVLYIWFKTGRNFSDAVNKYGYCNYEMLGGVEGDAHIIIEPAVSMFVRGEGGGSSFEALLRARKEKMEYYYDKVLEIRRFSPFDY
ncbi:MAG: hypothetical protein PUG15_06940 [Bacteroidales bacterium]|nr:hypothetical protein [Bacteroidales bacterium]